MSTLPTTTPHGPAPLSTVQATMLVARREIDTRVRAKSFQITTVLFVLVVVAGILVAHFVGGRTHTIDVGTTDGGVVAAVQQAGRSAGLDLAVTTVPSQDVGEAKLRDGSLAALVVPEAGGSDGFSVVVKQTLDSQLRTVLDGLARQQTLDSEVSALGGDPAAVTAKVLGAQAHVTALEPQSQQDTAQLVVAYLAGVLMYITLMIGSQLVAQGVVEEKTSRVVELLLSTVRPAQLMAGKVIGIGAVALLQVGITVIAAAVAATRTGVLDTSSLQMGPVVLWAVLWFLVGFTTFSILFAALGALVSRQEEVSSVVTPVTMVMVLPYVFGLAVLIPDPHNQIGTVASFIPFFAPFLMPIRAALGVAPLWELLLSLAISLVVLPVLVWAAGRIYSNAVLRTGARVSLKDALRG